MGVLCSRYHVSLIAPGLSTGPCRVSNLLGLEQNKGGGGETEDARGAGERQSDFYLLILACRRGPTFLLYQLRALAFPQVSSSKKDKKLALDSKIPRRDFLAHFRCKHSQEQSPGADISVIVSACQCADASRNWAQSLYPWGS